MRASLRFATIAVALPLVSETLPAQISRAEYVARRDSLAARLGNGILIAFGGVTPLTDFGPFYQLPGFRYLTGYEYADAALVMAVRGGRGESVLFVKQTAPRRSLYYGQEPDAAALLRELDLRSRPIGDVGSVVDSLVKAGLGPVYELRDFAAADFAAQDSLTRGGQFVKALAARHTGLEIQSAHPILNRLRARKSPAELALIKRAAEISAQGHIDLMRNIEAGMHEYDLQAIFDHSIRRAGSERPGYGAIVGSGPLSLQLHYMKNRRAIQQGEVVVVDAGAEYQGYAADVTRTLPISGRYSPEQRAIYQLVRDAQAAAERNSKAGMSMQAARDSATAVTARGLAALGLIESEGATVDLPWQADCTARLHACGQVTVFTIHGITHGLGLEVHDPMQAYQDQILKVGDAFVIEPGIYISPALLDMLPDTPRNRSFIAKVRKAVERYANTGVRIEDSYILTDRGLERISLAPREIDEIEALTTRPRPIP